MISVEFMPSGECSPLPNGERIYIFITFKEFKNWVQNYVCMTCLINFYQFTGKHPITLGDWLDMGCGCEIYIEDPMQIIDWDAKMFLPGNFGEKIEKYCINEEDNAESW